MTNDVFNVQRGITGRGVGNDTYIISPNLVEANAQIRITDAFGANTIQLIGGLQVTGSQTAADAVQLTLSNGAVITVLGASSYSFALGGDPLTGVAPSTVANFATFSSLLNSTPAFTVNTNTLSASDVAAIRDQATTDALTDADGNTYDDVDAAIVSNDLQVLLAAITAVDPDATTVQEVADNAFAEGVNSVDVTSNDAEALLAAITAVDPDATTVQEVADNAFADGVSSVDVTSNDAEATDAAVADATDFNTLADLVTAYNGLANPVGGDFVLTTAANTVIGQGAGDTITGTNATLNSTDIIIDATTGDGDVMTITATDDILAANAATVVGIETVNYTVQAFVAAGAGALTNTTFDVDTSGVTASAINLDVDQPGTSIVNAEVTGVATGTTVTASDDFSNAVTVTGDDNAAVTVNAAAATITANSGVGALTGATITNTLSGASTLVTNSDGAAVLVTTGGDMTVTAATATSVTATSSGSIDANTTDIAAATTVVLTAADEVDVGLDAAVSATISAGGTTASTIDDAFGNTLTTLSLSGNGSAHTFDVRNSEGVNSITITGEQNVTVGMSLADVSALTTDLSLIDTSSATSTVVLDTADAIAATDLTGVAADVINLGVANTQALTFASGANLTVAVNQAAGTFDGTNAGAATNTLTVVLNDGDDTNATGVNLSGVTLTDLSSVTVDASVDDGASTITSLTGSADDTSVTINAGANGVTLTVAVDLGEGDLTVNSTAAVAGGATAITAGSFTATGSGAVTLTAINSTTLSNVVTGSGNDNLTVSNTGETLTVNTGAGNDTVTIAVNTTANKVYTIAGGDGFDTLAIDDAVNASSGTLTVSGIERVRIVEDGGADGSAVIVSNSLLDGTSYVLTSTEVVGDGDVTAITVALGTGEVSSDLSGLIVDATFTDGDDTITITDATGANITLTGANGLSNLFATGSGNDVLTGGDSADTLNAGNGTNTINGGAGIDNITGGTGVDTIDGGAGDDIIDAGAEDDVITAGEGADDITVGTGADTVILTEDSSATDQVFIATVLDGSADGVAAGTFTEFNTVTGFEAGTDEVSLLKAVWTGSVTDVAGTDATVALNDLTAANYTNVDQVVNFIADLVAGGSVTLTGTGIQSALTVTLSDSLTAIYAFEDDAGATVDATEINLIGTVDTSILVGDVVIA